MAKKKSRKKKKSKSQSLPLMPNSLLAMSQSSNDCIEYEAAYNVVNQQYMMALQAEQNLYTQYLAAKAVADGFLSQRTAAWQAWQDCLNG